MSMKTFLLISESINLMIVLPFDRHRIFKKMSRRKLIYQPL